jgi:hypothetical protein
LGLETIKPTMRLSSEGAARIIGEYGPLAQNFRRSFSNNNPVRVFFTVGTFVFSVQQRLDLLRSKDATRRPGK